MPVPLVEFPLQLTTLVPMQGVSVMLNGSPEHVVSGFGDAITSGTSLIVIIFGEGAAITFPQASVTVGGGTDKIEMVSHVQGQLGMVSVIVFGVVADEQPVGVPTVTGVAIQGCVMVNGGTP